MNQAYASSYTFIRHFLVASSASLMAAGAWAQASFADVVEKADPAVVSIRTAERVTQEQIERLKRSQNPFNFVLPPGIELPPGSPRSPQTPRGQNRSDSQPPKDADKAPPRADDEEVNLGVGSGFFISADGYLLTNHHVVNGADVIYITLLDKRELKAKLVGSDARTDVALLKVEGANFPMLPIGSVSKLRKGDWVIAIGSPLGLESTVTKGIVSAKERDTGSFVAFLQTDVPINGGNSGGPLLNDKGEVVGINSRLISRTGGYQGISLAIPIDEAVRVSDQLKAKGSVTRGIIGVVPGEVTKEDAEALGLPKSGGAAVLNIVKGTPAEKVGLRLGDIILKFNGKAIDKHTELPRLAGATLPGAKATLEVWRAGKLETVDLIMGEAPQTQAAAPAKPALAPKEESIDKGKSDAVLNKMGLSLIELPKDVREKLNVRSGVLVDTVQGSAERAGLEKGDVLLAIGSVELTSLAQATELIVSLESGKRVAVLVKRGEQAVWLPVLVAAVK